MISNIADYSGENDGFYMGRIALRPTTAPTEGQYF